MRAIASLRDVADAFDVAVLDQWGVLHDGTRAYPGAVEAVRALRAAGKGVVVLSNSGKRASVNGARIRAMGFDVADDEVVTSGEALWADVAAGRVAPFSRPHAVAARPDDATGWARGLDLTLADGVGDADALLLLGFPDGADPGRYRPLLDRALGRGLPLVCANPDRSSPRAGGGRVAQPGALARDYAGMGGEVRWYGKPHEPVFRAVERLVPDVPRARLLMVGDSPEHDVAGAHRAGWQSALVRGGLHAAELADADDGAVAALCRRLGSAPPTVHLDTLGA